MIIIFTEFWMINRNEMFCFVTEFMMSGCCVILWNASWFHVSDQIFFPYSEFGEGWRRVLTCHVEWFASRVTQSRSPSLSLSLLPSLLKSVTQLVVVEGFGTVSIGLITSHGTRFSTNFGMWTTFWIATQTSRNLSSDLFLSISSSRLNRVCLKFTPLHCPSCESQLISLPHIFFSSTEIFCFEFCHRTFSGCIISD